MENTLSLPHDPPPNDTTLVARVMLPRASGWRQRCGLTSYKADKVFPTGIYRNENDADHNSMDFPLIVELSDCV